MKITVIFKNEYAPPFRPEMEIYEDISELKITDGIIEFISFEKGIQHKISICVSEENFGKDSMILFSDLP